MKSPTDPHYRDNFPAEIINHTVWLYHVFSLSLRRVELLLTERGIAMSGTSTIRLHDLQNRPGNSPKLLGAGRTGPTDRRDAWQ